MSRSRSFFFNTLLSKSSDLFFAVNEDLVIEEANAASKEILAYPQEDLRGTSFLNLLEPSKQVLVEDALRQAKEEGEVKLRVNVFDQKAQGVALVLFV